MFERVFLLFCLGTRPDISTLFKSSCSYCGYGWTAAPLLIPLLIQDMASKAGVEISNHAIPCNTTIPEFKCVTPFLGGRYYLDPGAISLYISSLSSIMSFFMSLSIAAVADHGCKYSLIYNPVMMITLSTVCRVPDPCKKEKKISRDQVAPQERVIKEARLGQPALQGVARPTRTAGLLHSSSSSYSLP